jgi:hypothetical protein
MKKLALMAAVVAAAAIFPTAAFAAFNGVVVGTSPGTLAIAAKSGAIHTVYARAHGRVGARVHVNGAAVRVIGRARSVRVHAVVVRRVGSTTFLAGGRSLVAVRSSRRLASVAQSGPSTGAVVNTTLHVTASSQLTAGSMRVVGQTGKVTVQAPVTAVGAGFITVSVNGTPLTIELPAGIQLPASLVGQSVTLTLELEGGQPVVNDDDEQGDDDDQGDDNDDQGDDHGDHDGHDGHGGEDGGHD